MYYKKMKCFIYDFVVMLFVLMAVYFGLIYTDILTISFNVNILTIALVMILIVFFIQMFNQVFFIGIRAICDLLFKNYIILKAIYVGQTVYRGSAFSEVNSNYTKGEGVKRIKKTYYKVIVKCNNRNITLTSNEYMPLSQGKSYTFTVGSTSHIIVGVMETKSI